jgi:UDP-2,3-diacylglucosamine hydrolase
VPEVLVVADHETALLGSDFHLSAQDPATADRVLTDLGRHGPECDHLFLLGDLFEVWVGDDGVDDIALAFADRLQRLSRAGVRIWMMPGNRDFLLGQAFAMNCGAQLLGDPTPVRLQGRRAILAHGDALCTDDLVYQQWRSTCRAPAWQAAFMARPLSERQAMGRQAREASEAGKRERGDALMDVNEQAVLGALRAFDCDWLIHGHTHRPADHVWQVEGRSLRRTVLTDWNAAQDRGEFLRLSGHSTMRLSRRASKI